MREVTRTIRIGAIVTAAYVAAAELGFLLAYAAEQVTTVWAPTGIAVAALLLNGQRLWPAVWLGAFIANATTAAPLWSASVVATGNTLEAVVAVAALRRLPQFDPALGRVADATAFIVIAALASTTVSATIGVATLCAAAVQPWNRFAELWRDWWLGDALGALVVAPAILTWSGTAAWSATRRRKTLVLVGIAVLVTHLVFGQVLGLAAAHPLEYIVFPVVIVTALIGGPHATSLVVLGASVVTIWNTVQGLGPFGGPELHRSLILLQTFMGVLAGTGLLLAAAIAERRQSEHRERDAAATLRDREQMLRLAQRAGGVATFEWDFVRQAAQCSSEFFRIFGLPAHDGVMTSAQWAAFVHPDDRDRMAAHLGRAIGGEEPATADYRIIAADGSTRWLSYAGQLQKTRDGERMLGTVVDITDRKQSEITLQKGKEAAETLNQLKDRFLATLSHELRTPLNVILGYARMLQMEALPPGERDRAVDVIARNAMAQARLVEELLDLSSISSGKVRVTMQRLAIAPVVHEVLEGVKPAAEAKHITIALEDHACAAMVTADGARLQQVFWNLLTNAVKFTEQGGRIDIRVTSDDSHVKVAIADSGVGIARDFLPFVFEPFRQGDDRAGHGGLGLGLAIAKQLVELHGGTIHGASDGPGHGSVFAVRLPRS